MKGAALTSENWKPKPADKYLPAWVILSMFAAVFVLSCSMTAAIKDICVAQPERCIKDSNSKYGSENTASKTKAETEKQGAASNNTAASTPASPASDAASAPVSPASAEAKK